MTTTPYDPPLPQNDTFQRVNAAPVWHRSKLMISPVTLAIALQIKGEVLSAEIDDHGYLVLITNDPTVEPVLAGGTPEVRQLQICQTRESFDDAPTITSFEWK